MSLVILNTVPIYTGIEKVGRNERLGLKVEGRGDTIKRIESCLT